MNYVYLEVKMGLYKPNNITKKSEKKTKQNKYAGELTTIKKKKGFP